ncbi:MAG: nickel pincer cofactor biosynthesis protein LarC [Candidatus Aminicenantes bacterium]|nr:nickel pincer cofactor biosynthesis protein LarC [Candidatus Aminicenantes bacterium]
MKFLYFDGSAGISGDMILGALLDLGVSHELFIKKMGELSLPVKIEISEVKRCSLRGLKVNVNVDHTGHIHRKWSDIETLIEKSPFSDSVKKKAGEVFHSLFQAESRAHGSEFHHTHLHEAGADDALVDIIGSCFLAEELGISDFYSSPLNVGRGWVKAAHGILPVPAPAVAELLKGKPVYSEWVDAELVTPTGAALATVFVKKFISFPEMLYEKIGYGAGGRDFKDFPNILRVFYGDKTKFDQDKKVFVVEANIDDCNPQILAAFYSKILDLGALDVYMTPVYMKKNRLATKLTILTAIDKIDLITDSIFKETSSIGIRYFPVERRVLERKHETIELEGEKIGIKVAYSGEKILNVQPEFDDCLRTAENTGIPLKQVMERALAKYRKENKNQLSASFDETVVNQE